MEHRAEQETGDDFATLLEQYLPDSKQPLTTKGEISAHSDDIDSDISIARNLFRTKKGAEGLGACENILAEYRHIPLDQRYKVLSLMARYLYEQFKSTKDTHSVEKGYSFYEDARTFADQISDPVEALNFTVATAEARFLHSAAIDDQDMERGRELLLEGYQELTPFFGFRSQLKRFRVNKAASRISARFHRKFASEEEKEVWFNKWFNHSEKAYKLAPDPSRSDSAKMNAANNFAEALLVAAQNASTPEDRQKYLTDSSKVISEAVAIVTTFGAGERSRQFIVNVLRQIASAQPDSEENQRLLILAGYII